MLNVEKIEEILDYKFNDPSLLITAVSHPSINYSKKKSRNFEKLEFLGDRVLGISIATIMFTHLHKESEVDFAIRLAHLASTESLIDIAYQNQLVENFDIILGQDISSGKHNSAIADIMEAMFAAIYLDSNLDNVIKIISKFILPKLSLSAVRKKDSKSKLQEYSQRMYNCLPQYSIIEISGPSHEPIFNIKVELLKYEAFGIGHSKKEAEQNAAENILKKIKGK